ncbi:T9SS type A sorting domain-containing protein [Taibaiella koreensis]|uniref:T9SS type A sorting domain-containing protein n=1 Tax=Taibaiella koreensis TaxID=1268548 RepID=UPI000E59FFE6|nr:T9SS type A sorting domain-containing protein [Taibaiella koreensis]
MAILFRVWGIALFLLLCSRTHALISADIFTNYTVSANDFGPGAPSTPVNVTIHPNCTLKFNNGAIVYFLGNINIMDHAALVIDGATVQMNTGGRIIVNGFSGPPGSTGVNQGGLLVTSNNAVLTVIPWIKTDKFWSGIETMKGSGGSLWYNEASVNMQNTTLSYADVGIRNYNKDGPVSLTQGGQIYLLRDTIKDCRQHMLQLYNEINGGIPTDPFTGNNANVIIYIQNVVFRHESGFNPVPFPQDMVYLNNCKGIPFYGCTFTGRLPANGLPNTGAIGINAINSGFLAEMYFANPGMPGCRFYGLKTGISVTNALQADRVPLIYRCLFDQCQYSVSMSGCLNPWIVSTTTFGSYNGSPSVSNSIPFAALSLNNCTGYKVEGNTIGYDIPAAAHNFMGVVIRNSGVANNELYRNLIGYPSVSLGAQSLGTNKSFVGDRGLKILCNNFNSAYDNNISVMTDLVPNGNNGIHSKQYVQGINSSFDLSAGNRFVANGTNPARNYYLEAGTFDVNQFLYKRNAFIQLEDPSYRTPFNVVNTNGNTCPIHNTGAPQPPYPFYLYVASLQHIEKQIGDLEAKANPDYSDTIQLEYLYGRQSELVDSVTSYYQQNDLIDSIILAYRQVTRGYHYQLLLAAAYATADRYDEALSALETIGSHYQLSIEEQEQLDRLVAMYEIKQWLYLHADDWAGLSAGSKTAVYDYAESDPLYAGATARSLLAAYEDKIYDPEFRTLPEELLPMRKEVPLSADQEKIYPNPAKDRLFVDWTGSNATLMLIDVRGTIILQTPLKGYPIDITISSLPPGIYAAQILVEGKIVYQQKVVKQ